MPVVPRTDRYPFVSRVSRPSPDVSSESDSDSAKEKKHRSSPPASKSSPKAPDAHNTTGSRKPRRSPEANGQQLNKSSSNATLKPRPSRTGYLSDTTPRRSSKPKQASDTNYGQRLNKSSSNTTLRPTPSRKSYHSDRTDREATTSDTPSRPKASHRGEGHESDRMGGSDTPSSRKPLNHPTSSSQRSKDDQTGRRTNRETKQNQRENTKSVDSSARHIVDRDRSRR